MHQYDAVLKSLLADSPNSLFQLITGARRGRWLNVELQKVTQARVDLLFELAGTSELILLELQSTNDSRLPMRMAEYALLIWRTYKRFPRMYVLYVGSQRLRMPAELDTPCLTCRYTLVDIRDWNAETLLKSKRPGDTILSILGRYSDRLETIRSILAHIAKMKEPARTTAFSRLIVLAGIRQLAEVVEQEAKQMPILHDIMDHQIIGPAIRKGRIEGATAMAERQIAARFGSLSARNKRSLAKLTLPELEDLSVRILTAKSISELFPAK